MKSGYGQIRLKGAVTEGIPNELRLHHVREDGKPGCGDPIRPWSGHQAVFVEINKRDLKAALAKSYGMCERYGCR